MNSLATASSADFACLRCGNCCRHAGEVRLIDGEAESIATALAMPPTEFTSRYTRLREDRRGLSLLDHPDGSCIFLSPACLCLIQSAKPKQCRDFPRSWKYENLSAICPASHPSAPASSTLSPLPSP